MQETGSLKIVYSVSERERARLTRRMCAYIPKRDKRRRLAVSLLATALLLVLYYGFFHNWQAVLDYLGSVGEYICEALCDESGQTAEDWDGLISGAAAARSHVAGLMYWMAALVLFVFFYMNWSWRKHIASLFDSLEGKQFSLEIGADGLLHTVGSDVRLFYRWPAVLRIIRDGECLLFYISRHTAYFVPAECFADAAAADAFYRQAQAFKEAAAAQKQPENG